MSRERERSVCESVCLLPMSGSPSARERGRGKELPVAIARPVHAPMLLPISASSPRHSIRCILSGETTEPSAPSSTTTMAALHAPSASFLSAFLPIVRATLNPGAPITRRIPLFSHLRTSILPAALLPIPSLLGEIWDGLLRAVPKKKTSHMKKRHRQMAGKALKDVTSLNKCSSCGRPKRAHVLCPYCVKSMCFPHCIVANRD